MLSGRIAFVVGNLQGTAPTFPLQDEMVQKTTSSSASPDGHLCVAKPRLTLATAE